MKAKILICTLLLSAVSTSFISCSNESEPTTETQNFRFKDDDGGVKIKEGSVKFLGQLHRGEKWSNKHGVKPCTTSFGLCNIRWGITGKVTLDLIKKSSSSSNQMRIVFVEPVDAKPGDVFISAEDDNVEIPQEAAAEILKVFEVSKITILADDYILKDDEPTEAPYGYVDVNVIAEK